MNIFSNPILLLVTGLVVLFIPRFFRFVTVVSLFAIGLIGLYATTDQFLES